MADQGLRKACDRCHAQKLSCPREGDASSACGRCLKAGVHCSTSHSLRNKRHKTRHSNDERLEPARSQARGPTTIPISPPPSTTASIGLSAPLVLPGDSLLSSTATPATQGMFDLQSGLGDEIFDNLFGDTSPEQGAGGTSALFGPSSGPGLSTSPTLMNALPPTPTSWPLWEPGMNPPSADDLRLLEPSTSSSNIGRSEKPPYLSVDMAGEPGVPNFGAASSNAERLRKIAQISVDVYSLAVAIPDTADALGHASPHAKSPIEFRLAFERVLALLFQFLDVLQELVNAQGTGHAAERGNGARYAGRGACGRSPSTLQTVDSGTRLMVAACYSHWLEAVAALLRVAARRLGHQNEVRGPSLDFPSIKIGSHMMELPMHLKAGLALEILERSVECVGIQVNPTGGEDRRHHRYMQTRNGSSASSDTSEERGTAQQTMTLQERQVLNLIHDVRQVLNAPDAYQ